MELFQIRQFSEINGVIRNPTTTENGKFPRFNSSTSKFDFTKIGSGDIDETYLTNFVTNLVGDTSDDYLTSINQVQTGSANSNYWASFSMAESATKYLKLGRLAWLDNFEVPTLPGDQKILFDRSNTLSGDSKLKYNYNTNKLLLDSTTLTFKALNESTYKEGLKYLGNYSWALGSGYDSAALGLYNIVGGYKSGYGLGSSSLRNTFYGPYSGEFAASTIAGNIGIGAYAGRYSQTSNKFFLDNIDYGSDSAAINGSFLYADLSTERRLYVRDRLAVTKEGKFGTSGLSDAQGEYGMYQMSAASGGTPQWHDGSIWQNFASSANNYLQEISEDPITEGLWHFVVKDSTGTTTIEDLTLQLPLLDTIDVPMAYTPSYPNITASDYGYIQISNSSDSVNKGFYYKAGFKWDNTLGELNIPGAIKLASKAAYTTTDNIIRYYNGHYYGSIAGEWVQLDNIVSSGTRDTAINLGEGAIEWFATKDNDNNLLFRTFDTIPLGNTYNPHDRIHLTYTTDGYTALIGTTAERNRLSTTVDNATTDRMIDKANEGETLHIRALRQGSNIVLTQTENYIQIDATTGGAATLMTGSSLGAYDIFKQVNGVNFEFYGVDTADNRIALTQGGSDVEFELNLTPASSNLTPIAGKAYSGSVNGSWLNPTSIAPTMQFKKITSDSISISETSEELILEITGSNATNVGDGIGLYVVNSAPTFEFKSLVEGTHISITDNTNSVGFDVDDITLNALGANTKLLAQDGSNSFIFNQKGLIGSNGVTITPSTNDVTFSIPNIEKFELSSGAFVKTVSYSGTSDLYGTTPSGTLSFKLNHDDVINDGTPSYTARTIAEVKLGGGLKYDSVNNVLWNDVALTGPEFTDHYLTAIDDDSDTNNYIFTFNVTDGLGNIPSGFESPTITIPKASVPTATYTDYAGGTGTKGILKVEEYYSIWPLGNTTPLALDVVTGKLSGNKLLVTYETQNNLHDADNAGESIETTPGVTLDVNTVREIARANIGSAYVNGDIAEEFNADDLNIAGILTANSTSDTHTLGGFTIQNNQLTGNTESTWKGTSNSVTNIRQTERNIIITIDSYSVGGSLIINTTTGNTMFKFDMATGNLYIKGKLFADGDVEAFTDDTTV